MAATTHRQYVGVTLPGAAASTKMLRAAVGQDAVNNQGLPLEEFIEVETTGEGIVAQ